jgi:hypothetical protein
MYLVFNGVKEILRYMSIKDQNQRLKKHHKESILGFYTTVLLKSLWTLHDLSSDTEKLS